MKLVFTLFVIGACSITAAPENLHRQRENFQYSSSSKKYVNNELADENENSGYYRAQHGNVGGNYEESHNMDTAAQRHLEEMKRVAEELTLKSLGVEGAARTSQQASFQSFGGQSFGSGYRTAGSGQQHENFGSGFGTTGLGQETESFRSGFNTDNLGQQRESFGYSRYGVGSSRGLVGQQAVDTGHNSQHSRLYSTTYSGKLDSLGRTAEDCDDQRTQQLTVGSHTGILEPVGKPTRYYSTAYTTKPVIQRTQTSQAAMYYTTHNTRDQITERPVDQLSQASQHYGKRDFEINHSQQTEDFGQQVEDLGQQSEDFGQQTEDLGQQTEDLGQQVQTSGFASQSTHNLETDQQLEARRRRPSYIGQTNYDHSSTTDTRYASESTGRNTEQIPVYRHRYPTPTISIMPATTAEPRSVTTAPLPDLEIDTADLDRFNKPIIETQNYNTKLEHESTVRSADSRDKSTVAYPGVTYSRLPTRPLATDSFVNRPFVPVKPVQPYTTLDEHTTILDKHMDDLLKLSQQLHSDTSATVIGKIATTAKPTLQRTHPLTLHTTYLGQQTEDLGQQTVYQSTGSMDWNQQTDNRKPYTGYGQNLENIGHHTQQATFEDQQVGNLESSQQTSNLRNPKPTYELSKSSSDHQNEDLSQQTQQTAFQSQQYGNVNVNQQPNGNRKPVYGYSSHSENDNQQVQQGAFNSQQSGNLERNQQTNSRRNPTTFPSSAQTERNRYLSHNDDLGQQNEELSQQTQQSVFQSPQTGELEWDQSTGNYRKPAKLQTTSQSPISRYPDQLGQQTDDLGQQTQDGNLEYEELGQHSFNTGKWKQDDDDATLLTQQSSRDIINREKEGHLIVRNKPINRRPQYESSYSNIPVIDQRPAGNADRTDQNVGVLGLHQQSLSGNVQNTRGSSITTHDKEIDSSYLRSASQTVARGDQSPSHLNDEDINMVGQRTAPQAPQRNNQNFAVSGSNSSSYGQDSQDVISENSDRLGFDGVGKLSGSFSQTSSSSSSYSQRASGSFIGRNGTRPSGNSGINVGDLQYGNQEQEANIFDQHTEDLQQQTLPNPSYGRRTEHGGYRVGSSGNLERNDQQTEDIGQQSGQFHFSSESSSMKHEEHQERSSFDILSGPSGSTNAELQMETMTPEEKRGFWNSLGHKAKNFAGRVRESLG